MDGYEYGEVALELKIELYNENCYLGKYNFNVNKKFEFHLKDCDI